jgi:COP9 signalosome complex subunit 2
MVCWQQLNVDKTEVEELLIGLILEGKVDGRIDQVNMRLELNKGYAQFLNVTHATFLT